ncbi:MAG: hypothetical protein ACTHZ9_07430 [Leucobacter sp.]
MSDYEYDDDELRERIALLEDPESDESILPSLPVKDVVIAIGGMVVLCLAMVLWGYGK